MAFFLLSLSLKSLSTKWMQYWCLKESKFFIKLSLPLIFLLHLFVEGENTYKELQKAFLCSSKLLLSPSLSFHIGRISISIIYSTFPIPSFRGESGCFFFLFFISVYLIWDSFRHLRFLQTSNQIFYSVLPSYSRLYWCICLWSPIFAFNCLSPYVFSLIIKNK